MKIADYRNLNIFLTILFNFFMEYKILSSVKPVDDYIELLEKILNAEFVCYRCSPGIEQYSVDFMLSHPPGKKEIYLLNFGKPCSNKSPGLLVNLGERGRVGSFSFSWYENRLPLFLKDFIDGSGMLVTENSDGIYERNFSVNDIMNIYEFIAFLQKNSDHNSSSPFPPD